MFGSRIHFLAYSSITFFICVFVYIHTFAGVCQYYGHKEEENRKVKNNWQTISLCHLYFSEYWLLFIPSCFELLIQMLAITTPIFHALKSEDALKVKYNVWCIELSKVFTEILNTHRKFSCKV